METNHKQSYSYNYEAALKQLNIKPETLSITDSDSQLNYSSDHQNLFNPQLSRASSGRQ